MNKNMLSNEVLDRLLLGKNILLKYRYTPDAHPDQTTLSLQVLACHDASELIFAAAADHYACSAVKEKSYLMDYIQSIEKKLESSVNGRDFFKQLNQVRLGIKHHGNLPNIKQWHRVVENTWIHLEQLCKDFLATSLEQLDESYQIKGEAVRNHFSDAKNYNDQGKHKECLECLAEALYAVFNNSESFFNLTVGESNAEDAIKLASYGVHSSKYLTLQEYLPFFSYLPGKKPWIRWEQYKFGHPANWSKESCDFCLDAFIQVALRIQEAEGVVEPVKFEIVYKHEITALEDDVQIFRQQEMGLLRGGEKVPIYTLKKGESVYGHVSEPSSLVNVFRGDEGKIYNIKLEDNGPQGEIYANKIKVTCVPKDSRLEEFLEISLPIIDFEP